jgi:hypothetical protein
LTSWFWTDFTALGAQGWVVENGRDGGSQCAGVNLLGGFNLYGKGARIRNKLALPPHYRLKVKVNYWKIDSWDNERGSVSVDGKEIWGRNYGVADGYQNTICGANQPGYSIILISDGTSCQPLSKPTWLTPDPQPRSQSHQISISQPMMNLGE